MAYNRPFPVDPVLTGIAIAFSNPSISYVADKFLPRVPVGGSKFSWTRLPIGEAFTVPNTQVGRRGRVERVEFTGEERVSECNDYGLEDSIPVSDINDAASMRARGLGNFDPVDRATTGLTDLILIDREVRAATIGQSPDSYPADNRIVLSGTNQFSDYDHSAPIDTIKAALMAVKIFRPNTMTMGLKVFDVLSSHPHIVNAVKGNVTGRGIVSREELAKLFGIDTLLVGQSYVNTARKGQPPTINLVWGPHISLTYINPMAQPETGMTFGMTAQYGRRIAGSYEDKDVGLEGGTVVRVGERVKEIVTAPEAGFLIQNAVAA